jgi:hypothetical protein
MMVWCAQLSPLATNAQNLGTTLLDTLCAVMGQVPQAQTIAASSIVCINVARVYDVMSGG